jgi:hypothetical protein
LPQKVLTVIRPQRVLTVASDGGTSPRRNRREVPLLRGRCSGRRVSGRQRRGSAFLAGARRVSRLRKHRARRRAPRRGRPVIVGGAVSVLGGAPTLGRVLPEALAGVEIVLGRGEVVCLTGILRLPGRRREVARDFELGLDRLEPLVPTAALSSRFPTAPPAEDSFPSPHLQRHSPPSDWSKKSPVRLDIFFSSFSKLSSQSDTHILTRLPSTHTVSRGTSRILLYKPYPCKELPCP